MSVGNFFPDTTPVSSNVVTLPLIHDTFVTDFMASVLSETAAHLLYGWFRTELFPEEDGITGRRDDFVLVKPISGPWKTSFSVHRQPGGLFMVLDRPDNGRSETWSDLGSFKTPEAAIAGIGKLLDRQLVAWGIRAINA